MTVTLITGASSGLGFEAAAQFGETGGVVLACRTLEKATRARDALVARTGREVFAPLAVDLGDIASVRRACAELEASGRRFCALVLNAGVLPGSDLIRTGDGVEVASAASLVGHHVLTLGLLRRGLLSPQARIVIAGSEGARGDAPGMKPIDLQRFARDSFGGNVQEAVRSVLLMEPPARHHWSTTYCTAKALVALWAVALAPHLPRGMTVNAVSPGNAPATNAARYQSWCFRAMVALSRFLGPPMGMAASVAEGARRYVDVAAMGDDVTGAFFASPPGKLIGPLTRQDVPSLSDPASARACLQALADLTGERAPETA